ncbi:MAG: ADOP family duplicated permease [Gemmatimonadaceae bacterium]
MLDGLRYRLRSLFRPDAHARELDSEIELHLALDTMQRTGAGSDARYAARRRFGNVTRYKEHAREMSASGFFDTSRQDVRFALRTLRQSPTFTSVAVLTIGLGIGATAAIFSVVKGVILEPLPYPDAHRVVAVWMSNPLLNLPQDVHSYPNLMDLRSQNRVLSHLGAYRETGVNVTGAGEPQRVIAGLLSVDAYEALGVRPMVGRFVGTEHETADNDGVVVISHGFWRSQFGGAQDVVGQDLEINGRTRTIIGVMPERYAFPSERTQLWLPLVVSAGMREARSWFAFPAIGRIAPNVSLESARADLETIAARLEQQYPSNRNYGVTVTPLPEQVVGPTLRAALWIVLGAVTVVLLIACANVANLLLSRATAREREVTVRMALGASGSRLVRQLLTESVLLSILGGVAGVVLAWAGLGVLRGLAPADLPRMSEVRVDGVVLAVTAAATIATGILFGMFPALQLSRTSLAGALREGGRTGTSNKRSMRVRHGLVAAQLGAVVVLLTAAGLLTRTFITLQRVELGFEPGNVLAADIPLSGARYAQPGQASAFYDGLLERLRSTPGVRAAGTVTTMFLSRTPNSTNITIEGRDPRPEDKEVTFDVASPGFIEAVGARLVAGRPFTSADRPDEPLVAVINEQMARYYWPNTDAIGRRFHQGSPGADTTQAQWITVVGVVADMRRTGVDMPVREETFMAHAQSPTLRNTLMVRTAGDPLAAARHVRDAVRSLDPSQPVSNVRTLDSDLSGLLAQRRFNAVLVGAFAVLALLLAMIGAYGVTAYLVAQRTREIGVRMALGAEPSRVTRLVVLNGLRVAAIGVAGGVVAAFFAARLASSLLHGVSPHDPITLVAAPLTLLVVVALANYVPARRAARVDPLTALRQD